jgi:hypothetical protein
MLTQRWRPKGKPIIRCVAVLLRGHISAWLSGNIHGRWRASTVAGGL